MHSLTDWQMHDRFARSAWFDLQADELADRRGCKRIASVLIGSQKTFLFAVRKLCSPGASRQYFCLIVTGQRQSVYRPSLFSIIVADGPKRYDNQLPFVGAAALPSPAALDVQITESPMPNAFPNMPVVPESIERSGDNGLTIGWSDRSRRNYTAAELRNACPCATCREKQRAKENEAQAGKPRSLPVLTAAELQPLTILRMVPLGNYAYNIAFSDGHDSGIYTFELLRGLGHDAAQ